MRETPALLHPKLQPPLDDDQSARVQRGALLRPLNASPKRRGEHDRMPIRISALQRYLRSCGLLLLPVFAWNAALAPYLPGAWAAGSFWRDIPPSLALVENVSRIFVVALPFLMPLDLGSRPQRRALALFGAGLALYFASWTPILLTPDSLWSTSPWGFLAPAYTPMIWLAALALLGRQLFWGAWYRWWMYLVPVTVFIAAHVFHAAIIYQRLP